MNSTFCAIRLLVYIIIFVIDRHAGFFVCDHVIDIQSNFFNSIHTRFTCYDVYVPTPMCIGIFCIFVGITGAHIFLKVFFFASLWAHWSYTHLLIIYLSVYFSLFVFILTDQQSRAHRRSWAHETVSNVCVMTSNTWFIINYNHHHHCRRSLVCSYKQNGIAVLCYAMPCRYKYLFSDFLSFSPSSPLHIAQRSAQ